MVPDSLVPSRKRRGTLAAVLGMYPQAEGSLPQQAQGDSLRPAPVMPAQPVSPLVGAALGPNSRRRRNSY